MSKKGKIILICSVGVVIIVAIATALVLSLNKKAPEPEPQPVVKQLKELPLPEITGGTRGELGIDKNINESTIDEYLNREDAVYRDMRMLVDPANYESIGGDRYLSGFVEGFKVIALPYIIPVTGLPAEVGETYKGTTLFYDDNGTYVANYKESMSIIESLFPKDKVIFLMCGGGGYAGMTKNFLVSMGWDETKIYNVGGYWYYKGEHNVQVKQTVDGKTTYDFDKVMYYNVEFDKLTKSANYRDPNVKVTELKLNTSNLTIEEGTSFQLSVVVVPNEATNKKVKWSSNNEEIFTVSENGLVKGLKPGRNVLKVTTEDGSVSAECNVTIKRKVVGEQVKIDPFDEEDIKYIDGKLQVQYYNDYYNTIYDSEGKLKEEYSEPDEFGGLKENDLANQEFKKYNQKIEQLNEKRAEIMNKLVDGKKTFIMLISNKSCGDEDYRPFDDAKSILIENNYNYFFAGDTTEDEIYQKTTVYDYNHFFGTVVIIKDGKFFAGIDQDVDALKNKEEVKNWLSKYLEIK